MSLTVTLPLELQSQEAIVVMFATDNSSDALQIKTDCIKTTKLLPENVNLNILKLLFL